MTMSIRVNTSIDAARSSEAWLGGRACADARRALLHFIRKNICLTKNCSRGYLSDEKLFVFGSVRLGAAAARCHAEGAAVRKAPHGDASPAPAGIFDENY